MTIIALSVIDAEFFYRVDSVHKVAKSSAQKIADALNEAAYKTTKQAHWAVHELIDNWSPAARMAESQAFKRINGGIREYKY